MINYKLNRIYILFKNVYQRMSQQPTQRAQLIKDIKALQLEKKIFFPPPVSKLNLVQLKQVLSDLKNTPAQPHTDQLQSLPPSVNLQEQPVQRLKQSKQQVIQPQQNQSVIQQQNQNLDDDSEDDEDDEFYEEEPIVEIKPVKQKSKARTAIPIQDKNAEQQFRYNSMNAQELDHIISVYNKDIRNMLYNYDLNNMDDESVDWLTKEYNQLRDQLDLDTVNCIDVKLLNKLDTNITRIRNIVSRYVS